MWVQFNVASGSAASINGGSSNTAGGLRATVSGGAGRSAAGTDDWRGGSFSSHF